MKEKLRNKKVVYTIIGIVSVLLVALAVTYAYWLVTKTQDKENVISSACLDIAISGEKNDITLTNQFPMSDEDGMKLVPYEFTVTNNCNTSVDYQVALEATGDSSNALKGTSLKVALNDSVKLYSAYSSVETTISEAYESRKLGMGTLASAGNEESSATYSLRIWIDEDAPISEMNKTFKSRISVTVGQEINNYLKEGTLAYSILSKVGGENSVTEIDETIYQVQFIYEHSNLYNGLSETEAHYYGTEYIVDGKDGEFKLGGTVVQATLTECRNGTKICGKYTMVEKDPLVGGMYIYEITSFGTSGNTVSAKRYKITNAFDATDNSGLYKTQDDIGDSYYFRGNVTNNYVKFGTWKEAASEGVSGCYVEDIEDSCVATFETIELCEADGTYPFCKEKKYANVSDSMYWRIVRINGDGTIRLIYDGTSKEHNDNQYNGLIGMTNFNLNIRDEKYAGYTYDDGTGTQVDSTIKGVVDNWYDVNLKEEYNKYIADSIFCNDRTFGGYSYIDDTNTRTNYGASDRIESHRMPRLKCTNKADRYTVSDTANGNGLLSNPIGLITADEAFFSGVIIPNNYLIKSNVPFDTMSPGNYFPPVGVDHITVSNDNVSSNIADLSTKIGVRPVINLKADVEFTGDGTIDNPYKIVTE